MRARPRRWSILAFGLAATSLASPAAQDQPQLTPFRTEVNYIRVDMYPTAGGAPVTDLTQAEVEILDGGVPQKIDRFERVLVRGSRSQEGRREPATVAEMREAAQDVRARLFVLFLDTGHVDFSGALNVSSPLVGALNQLIGGDDLIAVMTPGMAARDLTFTRRTTSIEEVLKTKWGERDRSISLSPEETEIATCYPAIPRKPGEQASDIGIAQEMILRRREARTLDALETLVQHLRYVREERKAVVTVSNGWRLYGDNAVLRRPVNNPAPPLAPLGVDPRTGRLSTMLPVQGVGLATPACEQLRTSLSMLQHEDRFRDILHQANAANTSFYPIDPRGLVVFDEDIVPVAGVGAGRGSNPAVDLVEDRARLNARNTSLRTMAEVTDGLAIVNTGEISAGLKRMVEDLSSYYLIGYYSTEKLDGKFHRLTVRVKRPGVNVRARTGYLAATPADATAARAAAAAVAPRPGDADAKAVEQPLSTLGIFSRERPLRMHVAAGWTPAGNAVMWVVAEVPAATARHDWTDGGQADAMLIDRTGATVATERLTIAPGTRSVRFALGSRAPLAPGEYQLQLRAKGTTAPLGAMESARVTLPAAPGSAGAVFVRRGVTTGNQPMPTADLRFRRNERIVLELPAPSGDAGVARLLDRMGKALAIPATTAIRDDADGTRWRTTQIALAPLAPGDYVIEVVAGTEKALTAFRVLP